MKKRPMIIKIILGGQEEEDYCEKCGMNESECECDSEEDDSEEED